MKIDQTALHPTMTNLLRCGVGMVWEKPCGVVLIVKYGPKSYQTTP